MQRAEELESPPEDGSVQPGPDPIAAERQHLEAAIVDARQRAAAAAARLRLRDAELRTVLRAEIEDARSALAELDRRHRAALDLVHETAELEIQRLRAAASADDQGPDRADEQ